MYNVFQINEIFHWQCHAGNFEIDQTSTHTQIFSIENIESSSHFKNKLRVMFKIRNVMFVLLSLLMMISYPVLQIYGLTLDELDETYLDAEFHFSAGNFTHAMNLYDMILETEPEYSDAIAGKGAIFHRMGDFSTALEYYDVAIGINATNPFFLSDKGNALLSLGLDDKSEQYLKESLKLSPTHVDALNGLANVYSTRGEYEEEIIYRTSVLIFEPNNLEALVGMGNAFIGLKEYDKAISYYDQALKIDSQNVNVLIGKGNVFLATQQYTTAIMQYDAALYIDPENLNALRGKSQSYVSLGQNKFAVQIYDEIESIKNDLQKDKDIKNELSITENKKIPDWVKNLFKWFSEDSISEDEVIQGLRYLIQNGIIKIN